MKSRRRAYLLLAALAALPRLVVLGIERNKITESFVDKSDILARTFVDHGTFGFIPGIPSAYTQPLYGFFLVPLRALAGGHWLAIGLAQIAVAVATALLVYEIGRRLVSPLGGLLAAAAVTLEPYVVWHDVHMNREILDELLAAAVVLLLVVLIERGGGVVLALGLGGALGLAILGNARLAVLPLVVAAFLVWQQRGSRRSLAAGALTLVACGAVLVPWLARNQAQVGCFTVTTDSRALWKANNLSTWPMLRSGGWIDDVPDPKGAPLSPQWAGGVYDATGRIVPVNECAQMRYYRHLTYAFWREHPGAKAKLTALGAWMLWQPQATRTAERRGSSAGLMGTLRSRAQPVYMLALYALGLYGLTRLRRRYLLLVLVLLAYQTALAMLFIGETRYRVPWDFLIAVPAAAGALALVERLRRARGAAEEAPA
jgi:hypothetical protein